MQSFFRETICPVANRRRVLSTMSSLNPLNILKRPSEDGVSSQDYASPPLSPTSSSRKKENRLSKGHENDSEAHQLFRSVAGHAPAHRQRKRAETVPSEAKKEVSKEELFQEQSKVIDQKADEAGPDAENDHEPVPGIAAPGSTGVGAQHQLVVGPGS